MAKYFFGEAREDVFFGTADDTFDEGGNSKRV